MNESLASVLGDETPTAIPIKSPDDDALILWTSGTTGNPKGVVHSHRSLLQNAKAKLQAVPQRVDDHRLTLLSVAHAYARTCDLGTWLISGCTLSIGRGFGGWLKLAPDRRPTLCNLVPSLASQILDQDEGLGCLRLLGCGGAAMSKEQFQSWTERGVRVIQGYGLTETGPVISSQTPSNSIPGHAGRLVDGWQSRIEHGRLFVRGPHLLTRYWNNPDETAAKLDSQGWFDTGDLVEINSSSGQLRILGRADDRLVLVNGM